MAKFSKGDKVESVKTGAKGVVDEVYGDEKYAVLFDGATNPDKVEGFQIKAANGCARNSAAARSTNAVVQNALNARAVCNGYVVLRTASGGTARVYEGDRVSYAGKEYVAKALGSPQMDKATLVDGSGNKLIVRLKDVDLKALNARTARNAGDPNDPQWREAEAAFKDAQRKVEAAKKEVEAIRKRLEGKKNYIVTGDLGRMMKYLDYALGNG